MLDAHTQLHQNPYFFRSLIETLLLDPTLTDDVALHRVRDRIALDLGYPMSWLTLNTVQRATALVLAMGESKTLQSKITRSHGEVSARNNSHFCPGAIRIASIE